MCGSSPCSPSLRGAPQGRRSNPGTSHEALDCFASLAMTAFRPSNHCPGDDVTLSTYAKIRTTICREWLGACARVKRRRGRRGSGESEDGPDRAGIGGMGTTTGTAPFVGERQGHYTPVVVIPPEKITE